MKIYDGHRMCDLFQLNFSGPSYKTIKIANSKGVKFLPGEHAHVFRCVAAIYREAKEAYGIIGPVPMILAENKTKVKSRVAWDSKGDHLISFYGPKLQRRCIFHFRPIIGTGEVGYNNIMEAFGNYQIAGFTRVIIVNPLHAKLPKLTLVLCCTCNCFDAIRVRQQ
jgi:hypothetical protein